MTTDKIHPPAKRSCRAAQIVLCLVVFVSGGLIGIGATVIFPEITAMFDPPPPPTPEARIERWVQRLADRLDLDDQQVVQLRPIMAERMEAFRSAFQVVQPQMVTNFKQMDEQIRPLLTPEQVPLWQEYYNDRMARYAGLSATTQPTSQP